MVLVDAPAPVIVQHSKESKHLVGTKLMANRNC